MSLDNIGSAILFRQQQTDCICSPAATSRQHLTMISLAPRIGSGIEVQQGHPDDVSRAPHEPWATAAPFHSELEWLPTDKIWLLPSTPMSYINGFLMISCDLSSRRIRMMNQQITWLLGEWIDRFNVLGKGENIPISAHVCAKNILKPGHFLL